MPASFFPLTVWFCTKLRHSLSLYGQDTDLSFRNLYTAALPIQAFCFFVLCYALTIRPKLIDHLYKKFFNVVNELSAGNNTLTIQQDGLLHATGHGHSLMYYATVTRITNLHRYLLIQIGEASIFAVPHHAFADDAERHAFAELLCQKTGLLLENQN